MIGLSDDKQGIAYISLYSTVKELSTVNDYEMHI